MYKQIDKPKGNKSRATANSVVQKASNRKQDFEFVDNRPEAVVQRKLQEIATSSPQRKQTIQLLAIANNHATEQQQLIQKKENNTGLHENIATGHVIQGYFEIDISNIPQDYLVKGKGLGTWIKVLNGHINSYESMASGEAKDRKEKPIKALLEKIWQIANELSLQHKDMEDGEIKEEILYYLGAILAAIDYNRSSDTTHQIIPFNTEEV